MGNLTFEIVIDLLNAFLNSESINSFYRLLENVLKIYLYVEKTLGFNYLRLNAHSTQSVW